MGNRKENIKKNKTYQKKAEGKMKAKDTILTDKQIDKIDYRFSIEEVDSHAYENALLLVQVKRTESMLKEQWKQAGRRDERLLLEAKLGGIVEIYDWSVEGLKGFRKSIEAQIKEWEKLMLGWWPK